MIGAILLGSVFILINVNHLLSKSGGMHAPLPNAGSRATGRVAPTVPQGPNVEYHVIFSTGCSPKQNFQAYVFFFHAMKSQQPGTVWRIAACGSDQEKTALEAHFKEFIEPMSPNFKLHITPDYSGVKPGHSFHYFNKPFSTHHWMENALGYNPQHRNVGDNKHDDAIIILCDPDQIIMRPFTNNKFNQEDESWIPRTSHPILDAVTHGKPMAAMYGYGDQWATKTNITRYVPKEELPSLVQTMSRAEKDENYAVGPPYIVTAHDFYTIATRWKNFVPLVHDDYPYLLAEMFAYSLAACHSQLPHQIAKGFMLSDVGSFGMEGWNMIEPYSKRDVCTAGAIPNHRLPHILHYCQRYTLGKFVIGKHRIPSTFLSCEDPLLMVPPPDLAEKFDFAIEPDKPTDQLMRIPPKVVKSHGFMLCHLIPYLNEAAIYWKDNHCAGKTVNKETSLKFFNTMEVDQSFFDMPK